MISRPKAKHPRRWSQVGAVCAALLCSACSIGAGRAPAGAASPGAVAVDIEDLSRVPQDFQLLARSAGDRLGIEEGCRRQLLDEFQSQFFAPWSPGVPALDPAELKSFMNQVGRAAWYGPNKRKVAAPWLRELLENCALDRFPSRNDTAISVAPGHLRGLPTELPFFETAEGYPFDMLSFPQLKLNEPLRVLHASRDGVWLFVETGSSNGWIVARDVALVDRGFIDSWMRAPRLVVVRDLAPVPDGRGTGVFRAKVGTILPLASAGKGWWEVAVASAGEGGRAQSRPVRIPSACAAPFPLAFGRDNVALVGGELQGQPYGWGEANDQRDCSAMLRDFFLPFGIWLPRTSGDQIASLPRRLDLAGLTPPEKEALIRREGLPFLTLFYKPGHIMLYVGVDREGRPLVFHNAWSIRVEEAGVAVTRILGASAVTTLEPGKELGLVTGSSLLERGSELGTITERCRKPSPPEAPRR